MKKIVSQKTSCRSGECGQALLLLLLALGIFLMGAVALTVDISNAWFHRQAAQNAADAACIAGSMDMLVDAQGGATGHQGFTIGTQFNCSSGSAASPCQYAAFNGYDSSGSATSGNLVTVSFPGSGSVPGLPSSSLPPTSMVPSAFMRVDVIDNVQTFFFGLFSGQATQQVRAKAMCGVVLATSPIPILVLDPKSPVATPAQSALNIQGNGAIAIVGGPTKSIQVNSALAASSCGQSNCSVNLPWGSATVDLSKAGPAGTGADIGLYGAPTTAPSGFLPGTTGHWVAPASPVSDPFAQVCAPGQTGCPSINSNAPPAIPAAPTVPADEVAAPKSCASIPCNVAWKDHGCPDPSATIANGKCVLYTPGHYTANVTIKNVTAVFDPGLYYLDGGLTLGPGSIVRPGTGDDDATNGGGTIFYFSGSSTVTVDSNSGKTSGLDNFNTLKGPVDSSGNQYPNNATVKNVTFTNGVKCAAGSTVPTNLQGSGTPAPGINVNGNILLGVCTGYYGDPLGTSDPIGLQHEFLFFQDRSAKNVNPSWGGGGQFLLAGTMYFHSCNSSGTGVGCGAANDYYNDIFSLSGNSGSGTYVLGDIVVDNLTLGGTSGITMDLNPNVAFSILKATLLPTCTLGDSETGC